MNTQIQTNLFNAIMVKFLNVCDCGNRIHYDLALTQGLIQKSDFQLWIGQKFQAA
ncbi:hypothetical protein [Wielerella bovis]|uniref:hypothetical protein n=1 Tax=Wielerella bovis TaxID=2917790 RepID=UPI002019B981|nr:hypothetical protein [Wielerella bovis]MCG7657719.1 hypothetical protein [Wielerella bovis]MCG7659940.1 hypothetical protein [Wielerella bovis]